MIIYSNVNGTRVWMLDVRNKTAAVAPTGAVRLGTSDPGEIVLMVRTANDVHWSSVILDADEAKELIDGLNKMLETPKEEEE